MSKLIDMLEKAGQQLPGPMGFGPATGKSAERNQIVLLARVLSDVLAKDRSLTKAEADAFLVGGNLDEADEFDNALGDRTWGFRNTGLTAADASKLAESGCDFVVFESFESEAAVLNIEDLGLVATVDADMDEEAVHSLGALPISAALRSPSLRELPLTVQTAADIQKLARLVGKPTLVEAPEGIGRQDIEVLRNIGVAGLIIDLDRPADVDRISETREAIAKLPKRLPKSPRSDALLPQVGFTADAGADADEPDDDEDF